MNLLYASGQVSEEFRLRTTKSDVVNCLCALPTHTNPCCCRRFYILLIIFDSVIVPVTLAAATTISVKGCSFLWRNQITEQCHGTTLI